MNKPESQDFKPRTLREAHLMRYAAKQGWDRCESGHRASLSCRHFEEGVIFAAQFPDPIEPVASPAPSSRERTLERRTDFANGAKWAHSGFRGDWDDEAKIRFPLPAKVQPRVLRDPADGGRLYRFDSARNLIETNVDRQGWTRNLSVPMTPERIALWNSLALQPDESVPDEE